MKRLFLLAVMVVVGSDIFAMEGIEEENTVIEIDALKLGNSSNQDDDASFLIKEGGNSSGSDSDSENTKDELLSLQEANGQSNKDTKKFSPEVQTKLEVIKKVIGKDPKELKQHLQKKIAQRRQVSG